MAVRCRQRLEQFSPQKIYLEVVEINPDTQVGEHKYVDQCAELPDAKTMDLGLMLKAGVPLNDVDCKLLDPVGTVVLAEVKPAEKVETKTEEK